MLFATIVCACLTSFDGWLRPEGFNNDDNDEYLKKKVHHCYGFFTGSLSNARYPFSL